ncbi:MAG: hypothetical protein MSC30_01360 [Gaiellaceae bacterium MAG52_C11]|nr:hypothetical protein [Candidatus Gaiellasilicea maunaloa]
MPESVRPETVKLRDMERDVALAEAQAVYILASEPGYRDDLAALLAAIDEGELDSPDVTTLERVLELALQTGRVRAIYGPGGEQAALRLYRRLPRGSELGASAAAVTGALTALVGRRLDSVRLEATGPGSFALAFSLEGADVSIRLDRQGARLTSLAT